MAGEMTPECRVETGRTQIKRKLIQTCLAMMTVNWVFVNTVTMSGRPCLLQINLPPDMDWGFDLLMGVAPVIVVQEVEQFANPYEPGGPSRIVFGLTIGGQLRQHAYLTPETARRAGEKALSDWARDMWGVTWPAA